MRRLTNVDLKRGFESMASNIKATKKLEKNKVIKVRFKDNLRLFCISSFGCLQKKYEKDKLWKMYSVG